MLSIVPKAAPCRGVEIGDRDGQAHVAGSYSSATLNAAWFGPASPQLLECDRSPPDFRQQRDNLAHSASDRRLSLRDRQSRIWKHPQYASLAACPQSCKSDPLQWDSKHPIQAQEHPVNRHSRLQAVPYWQSSGVQKYGKILHRRRIAIASHVSPNLSEIRKRAEPQDSAPSIVTASSLSTQRPLQHSGLSFTLRSQL